MASFFFDTDTNMRIARRLLRLGHMLTSAQEQHLERATDTEILLSAGRQQLILVTHNERDFVELHRRGTILDHAGIVVLPQVPTAAVNETAEAVDRLVTMRDSLSNQLYRLRVEQGWERWDIERDRWLPA